MRHSSAVAGISVQHGSVSILDAVKRLADANRYELGFIMRPTLEEAIARGGLLVATCPGELAGFALSWHRRDEQTTLHAIAVSLEARGQGIGRALIDALRSEARGRSQRLVLARCPIDLPSNRFYTACGFALDRVESGKSRALNVWTYFLKEEKRSV